MSLADSFWRYDRVILPILAFIVGFVVANPSLGDAGKASVLQSEQQQLEFEKAYQEEIDGLREEVTTTKSQVTDLESENENLTEVIDGFSIDRDSDGLADYLEEMLGTDPAKADTDSDGFKDLQEIQNGYNPKEGKAKATVSSEPLAITDEPPATEEAVECLIKGQENGIYHLPGSKYYDQIKDVKEWFCSLEEALAAGYRPPVK